MRLCTSGKRRIATCPACRFDSGEEAFMGCIVSKPKARNKSTRTENSIRALHTVLGPVGCPCIAQCKALVEGRAGLTRVSGFCRDRILGGRDSQRLGKSAFVVKPQSAFTDRVQSVAYRSKDGIWFATIRAMLYRRGQQWGQPSIIYFNSTFIINALQILFGSRRPYVYDSF